MKQRCFALGKMKTILTLFGPSLTSMVLFWLALDNFTGLEGYFGAKTGEVLRVISWYKCTVKNCQIKAVQLILLRSLQPYHKIKMSDFGFKLLGSETLFTI